MKTRVLWIVLISFLMMSGLVASLEAGQPKSLDERAIADVASRVETGRTVWFESAGRSEEVLAVPTCCRWDGDAGPVDGSVAVIGGVFVTADGVAQDGVSLKITAGGLDPIELCTYAGAGDSCPEQQRIGIHTDGEPYWGIKLDELFAADRLQNGVLVDTQALNIEAKWIDSETGQKYATSGVIHVTPEAFDAVYQQLQIDIELHQVVTVATLDETNWPLVSGVSLQGGMMSITTPAGGLSGVQTVSGTRFSAAIPQPELATGSTITEGYRPYSPTRFIQFEPDVIGTIVNSLGSSDYLCVHEGLGDDLNNCSCGSIYGYCRSVARAIEEAEDGETILVAGGEYKYDEMQHVGSDAMVPLTKDVDIYGGYYNYFTRRNPVLYPTILNAQQRSRVMSINVPEGEMTIDGVRFTGGRVGINGGGVAIDTTKAFTLSNVVIYENETTIGPPRSPATYGGGGIYAGPQANNVLIINSGIYSNTTASLGAGIRVNQAMSLTITHVDIAHNTSIRSGGGLYIEVGNAAQKAPIIQFAAIRSNHAGSGHGGGWIANGRRFQMISSLIYSNTAGSSHAGLELASTGAVFDNVAILQNRLPASSSSYAGLHIVDPAILRNVTIGKNWARQYSGLTARDTLVLDNVLIFENESASSSYAGAYLLATNDNVFNNVTFLGNISYAGFAGLYVRGSNNQFSNVHFVNNRVQNIGGLTGGFVYLEGDDNRLKDIFVHGNIAQNTDSSVSEYSAGMVLLGNHFDVEELIVAHNSTINGAAAIRLEGQDISFRNIRIENNYGSMGPLYTTSSARLTLDRFRFVRNESSGHAIYINGNDISLINGEVSDNISNDTLGHCLYLQGSSYNLTNLMIVNNEGSTVSPCLNVNGNGQANHLTLADAKPFTTDEGVRVTNGTVDVINSIVSGYGIGFKVNSGTARLSHNNVFGNNDTYDGNIVSLANNIGCDPLFADPAAGNFNLTADNRTPTCAVDQGLPIEGILTDYEGGVRVVGAAPDIGADEFGSGSLDTGHYAKSRLFAVTTAEEWYQILLETVIPVDTAVYLTVLDQNGLPINGYRQIGLVDGLNTISLRALDAAEYATIKLQLNLAGTPELDQVPQVTAWQLDRFSVAETGLQTVGGVVSLGKTPIAQARVHLLHNGQVVAETDTDRFGRYSFSVPRPDDKAYQVRVVLREHHGRFEMRYATASTFAGPVPNITGAVFNLNNDAASLFNRQDFDLSDTSQWTTNIDRPGHVADIAYSFMEMVKGVNFFADFLGAETVSQYGVLPVNIFAAGGYDNQVVYIEAEGAIVIGQIHAPRYVRSAPANREFHELAHHYHSLSRAAGLPDTDCAPAINHAGHSNCDTVDSLMEGTAVFMATEISEAIGRKNPRDYVMGLRWPIVYNLEYNWPVWYRECRSVFCPEREELSVASLLVDLVDAPTGDDSIEISTTDVWQILTRPEVVDLYDLYVALEAAEVGQMAGRSDECNLSALEEVFVSHKIFLDENEDKRFQCEEQATIGRAADTTRPDRTATPYLEQYIAISSNYTGTVVPLTVQVTFSDTPELNYSYETEAVDGFAVIPPLPAESGAVLTIRIEDESFTTVVPLVLDNTEYAQLWEDAAVEGSTLVDAQIEVVERTEETKAFVYMTGWQIAPIDLVLADSSPETVFAPIADVLDVVLAYDACDGGRWKRYEPNGLSFLNDLTDISPTAALWIKVSEPVTLSLEGMPLTTPEVRLCAGANLVPPPFTGSVAVADALSPINSHVEYVYSYTPNTAQEVSPWQAYFPGGLSFLNTLTELDGSRGYWVKVDQDVTWVMP